MTKTILVTGAGSGIGAATVRTFHAKGWMVGAFDINERAVGQLKDELGDRIIVGYMDVTDRDSVTLAFRRFAEATDGRLDVMCNNAGVFDDVRFAEQKPQMIEALIDINIKGVTYCAQEAFPLLKRTTGARLVNVASGASIYGVPMEAVYSATKFYVRGLSEALELEWQDDDIGIAVIMPSYVATPMVHNATISWGDHFGIKLTAEDVADTIWKSCHSRKMYWPTPVNVRMLMTLVRAVPLGVLPGIVRKIFHH